MAPTGSSSRLRQLLSSLLEKEEEEHRRPYSSDYYLQFTSSRGASYVHSILLFIVPALLDLLDLKYCENGTSPFTTHPKTMRFSVGCLLAYCVAYVAERSVVYGYNALSLRRGMMKLFGSLAVVSLSSIFVEDSFQWIVYVVYTLLCVGKLLYPVLYKLLLDRDRQLLELLMQSSRGVPVFHAPFLRCHTFTSRRSNLLPL